MDNQNNCLSGWSDMPKYVFLMYAFQNLQYPDMFSNCATPKESRGIVKTKCCAPLS